MKKFMIAIAAALLGTFLPGAGAMADEGMWTLYNLPPAVYQVMQQEGFQMPYEELYKGNQALKNCVVNFGGFCTGVVVSPDGLVMTNHHCGFEAIRSHSTVEHDYMLNGFTSESFAEELPNEGLFVQFMTEQEDITPKLDAMGFKNMSKEYQEFVIDSLQQAMTDSISSLDNTLHVEVDAFYEGNRYYATTYRLFPDVRLVFALPKSMGKFGGETDNWMWPRQTCDFSVFRIYVDPETGKPAAYSEKNVPYHPERWAEVSMEGYKEGDFAMTVGYPGSTERYLSSYGIRQMRDAENAVRAQARGVKQEVMRRHMEASEAVRIKYDSKYAQSSNYWKNAIGMNKCIDSIGIINQKKEYEERLRAWQDSTGYLKGKLDFDLLESLYGKQFDNYRALNYFFETFSRNDEFTTRALKLATEPDIANPENKPKNQYVIIPDNSDSWDADLDREVLGVLLKNFRDNVAPEYLPMFYEETIDAEFGGNCQAFADYLYSKSLIMKSGTKLYPNRKKLQDDPGYKMGIDLAAWMWMMSLQMSEVSDSIDLQERYLCAAKLRMEEDQPHYSDANFTMRLSYGQVGGYNLAGQPSGYYTTAESMVAKIDRQNENAEYFAEPIMRDLLSVGDFGPYQDKTTGKMQLCFLTNNDITGGNSGSPMFDGKGRLIGLAFDGNWDSLSSDIHFDTQLARCIGVDIRYVLYMMDSWGKADRLLREMGIK